MIEVLVNLFNQISPNQAQETIDSSWNQLRLLYKNKSIIQPLIQIYTSSVEPFYKIQSLFGIKSCLFQLFVHFNQTEIYNISEKIVEIYLKESNDFLKVSISEIICYLIDQTRQTWPQLDHFIYQTNEISFNYLKILFRYSILFPNKELILLKVSQSFNSDLKTQLGGFEILLYFIHDQKKIFDTFSFNIQGMIRLILSSNNIKCFDTFCKIYKNNFSSVYPYFPIFAFISNLTNNQLHPSILILMRDFLNSNLMKMLEYQYQMNEQQYVDRDKFFQETLIQIFTQEISLSIHLYSIEIDEMSTTNETFSQLINFLPKELIESTIKNLVSSKNCPSLLTSISLFTAFIHKYGGNEEHYNFFVSYLNFDFNIIRKMTIDSLYELKEHFRQFYQLPLIKFLMDWIGKLKSENKNDNSYLIHQLLIHMCNFLKEFDDISPILNEVFVFGTKILNDGNLSEMYNVLFLFNNIISNNQTKNNKNNVDFYNQLLQILFQLINRTNSEDIIMLCYATLTSILFANKEIFTPYLDAILQNPSNIFALRFISVLLAFFEDKVGEAIQKNIQKIVEICDNEVNDPFRTLTAFEIEVTIFLYYKGQINISPNIFKLFFLLIPNAAKEMHGKIKVNIKSFLKFLFENDKNFDPNSLIPNLMKELGGTFDTDKFVLKVAVLISHLYFNRFNLVPFYEYALNRIESIFQSKNINQFVSFLICSCNFFVDTFDILDNNQCQQVIPRMMQIASSHINVHCNQIIDLVCLRMILYVEQKVGIQDLNVIEKVINFLNVQENEDDENDLSNDICCTSARFVRNMMIKNPEIVPKYSQPIVNLCLLKLSQCNDLELSDNLVFILINMSAFYKPEEEVLSLLLSHFPVRTEQSLFESCYGWVLKILNSLPEQFKLIALRSIIQFFVCDIRQFYEDGDLSKDLLVALFSVVSTLPQKLVSESLNNNEALVKVFISHLQYVSSTLLESK